MASSTDWARSIATTIVNHLREEEVASLRKYKVFAALEGSGNIRTNMSGRGFDWEIQYRNHTPSGNNGETPRSFARQNLWKNAELEYRGAQVTDAIYKKEMLENRSAQALVNVAGKMSQRLLTSMEQYLAKEWTIDGYAAGNELRFHGIESFMGTNGTVNVATGAQRRLTPLTRLRIRPTPMPVCRPCWVPTAARRSRACGRTAKLTANLIFTRR